jgi:hypothetical protein
MSLDISTSSFTSHQPAGSTLADGAFTQAASPSTRADMRYQPAISSVDSDASTRAESPWVRADRPTTVTMHAPDALDNDASGALGRPDAARPSAAGAAQDQAAPDASGQANAQGNDPSKMLEGLTNLLQTMLGGLSSVAPMMAPLMGLAGKAGGGGGGGLAG